MNTITTPSGQLVRYVGSNEDSPLPAIFYFALSASDSLGLEPFNQPVEVWKQYPLRVYSITLPGHEEHFTTDVGIMNWIAHFREDKDPLTPFFKKVSDCIDELVGMGLINNKIGLAGLSRGGFIATHVAAINQNISHVLGFAPLTTLRHIMEFHELNIDASYLDLIHLTPQLYRQTHRYYIGNRDERVSTKECFHYVMHLANEMHANNIRSMGAELFITPSIGRHGHGTSKQVFEEGSHWLARELGCGAL